MSASEGRASPWHGVGLEESGPKAPSLRPLRGASPWPAGATCKLLTLPSAFPWLVCRSAAIPSQRHQDRQGLTMTTRIRMDSLSGQALPGRVGQPLVHPRYLGTLGSASPLCCFLPGRLAALPSSAAVFLRGLSTLAAPAGPHGEPCWAQVGWFTVTTGLLDQPPTLPPSEPDGLVSCAKCVVSRTPSLARARQGAPGVIQGCVGRWPPWAWCCSCLYHSVSVISVRAGVILFFLELTVFGVGLGRCWEVGTQSITTSFPHRTPPPPPPCDVWDLVCFEPFM